MQLVIIFWLNTSVGIVFLVRISCVHSSFCRFGLNGIIEVPITFGFIILISLCLHFLLQSFLLDLLVQVAQILYHFVAVIRHVDFLALSWMGFR